MAKWRSNGKEIREIKEWTLDEVRRSGRLEPGDMIQHISGEMPFKNITMKWKSTLVGDSSCRFSVISADYVRKKWGWKTVIQMVGIDTSRYDLESKLLELVYDPYMKGTVRIFPIDSVDQW